MSEADPQDRDSDKLAQFLTDARRARMDHVLDGRVRTVTVVLENLYDPHNISAVLRTCEGLGIQDVHVVETKHGFKFSSGVTRGCEKWLTIHRHRDPETAIRLLHEQGFEVLVADQRPGTPRVERLDPLRRRAFWMGAEHAGPSTVARELADGTYGIPMAGFTESFNVSVAAAVTLYTARSRWEEATGREGDLTPAEREALRLQWLKRQIHGADDILARFDVGADRKSWRTRKDDTGGPRTSPGSRQGPGQ